MRTATTSLAAHLTTQTATLAFDLYTITLASGQVIRWTNADKPLTDASGNTYALGPTITRSKCRWQRGVQTDTLNVTLGYDATVQVNGVPLAQFSAAGGFTNATLTLLRAFYNVSTMAFQGALIWFVGLIADVDSDRYTTSLQIKDSMSALSIQMPRNLFQGPCGNTLYDSVCSVTKANYAFNLSASSVDSINNYVRAVYTGQPSGYFALGTLQFTSGKNAGVARVVKAHATYADHSDFVLARPFPLPLELNATFVVYPGCDKTMGTCAGKYNNLVRFRGQPFIPDPSTVT